MKKIKFVALFLFLSCFAMAQTDTTLASLKHRLDSYTKFNKELNFQGLMDYIHPSIYKLAPREALIQAFSSAFNNEQIGISIDSIGVIDISNDFILKKVQYKKVDYFMSMTLKFKDEEASKDEDFIKKMTEGFRQAFSKKTVNYLKDKNAFEIKGADVLIAIKDTPASPWMFLGYDPSNEATKQLFAKELTDHFKLK